MAGAIVQTAYTVDDSGATSTTVAATLSGVAAGNALVGFVGFGDGSGTTATGFDGTSYTADAGGKIRNTTDLQSGQVFYLPNAGSGSHTLTITFGIAVAFRRLRFLEVSGIQASAIEDKAIGAFQTGVGTGTDSISSTATAATTNANDFVLGFQQDTTNIDPGSGTMAAGTGYTLNGVNQILSLESKSVTATGAQTATFTDSKNSNRTCHVLALKEVAGITPPAQRLPFSNMRTPGGPSNVMRAFFKPPPQTVAPAGASFSDTVAESIAFTDGQTAQVDFAVSRAESIAFTDAQTGAAVFSTQRDESIAFTDAQTAAAVLAAQRDESIAFTDAQTAQADFVVARAESVAFTDAQTAQTDFVVARAESIAFTDAQDATIVPGGSSQVDESIAFTDAQTAQTDFVAQVNESIGFTDAQTGVNPASVTVRPRGAPPRLDPWIVRRNNELLVLVASIVASGALD